MERGRNSWVQVIGSIAIHDADRRPTFPTGTSRTLLAILVAGGPEGVPIEAIAHAYWSDSLPDAWRTALRLSTANLVNQLPDGWTINEEETRLRLVPWHGFVDAWRVSSELERVGSLDSTARWLSAGQPFADITGIGLIDDAAIRVAQLLEDCGLGDGGLAAARLDGDQRSDDATAARINNDRRLIVLGSGARCASALKMIGAEEEARLVIGDRGLLLPLGPFAMAFPELRQALVLEQGVVDYDATLKTFELVSDLLAMRAVFRPQRLILDNAHELDRPSLLVVSMLIESGSLDDFALLVCADHVHRDLRWLDFMARSTAAGCSKYHLPLT